MAIQLAQHGILDQRKVDFLIDIGELLSNND